MILCFSKVQNVNWSTKIRSWIILKLCFISSGFSNNASFLFSRWLNPHRIIYAASWAGSESFGNTGLLKQTRRDRPEWDHEDQLLNSTNFECLTQPPLRLSCIAMRMAASSSCSFFAGCLLCVQTCRSHAWNVLAGWFGGIFLAVLPKLEQALGCRDY